MLFIPFVICSLAALVSVFLDRGRRKLSSILALAAGVCPWAFVWLMSSSISAKFSDTVEVAVSIVVVFGSAGFYILSAVWLAKPPYVHSWLYYVVVGIGVIAGVASTITIISVIAGQP